ncbi:hypothetical protein N7450_006194 [Penicillium hetheringtonii]|uniref:Integral membrane protein n=1 Tax=Penicillium hetheringtonii TaxID=911720 RepID=A0AAD6DJW3_9EURO|nr:hypothetical protein N7450_006194 [Penicillium hetheringtonii]
MDNDDRVQDRDRIEPIQDYFAGNAPEAQAVEQPQSTPERPPLATLRPRAPSTRSRRPSIRLSRLPSLETDNLQSSQPDLHPGPSGSRPPEIRSPVQEEEESPNPGRRRSSSEPRPGRWSSPSADVLSRVASPMKPLREEASHQSPTSPLPRPSEARDTVPGDLGTADAPPVAQPGRLRRTSQAALNRFSRNRASTVTGVPPTLDKSDDNKDKEDNRPNEYGSHVVDVLDVIDPEVSALSTLTNVQNSLFVPNLGDSDGDKLKQRPTLEQLRPFTSMSSVLVGPRYAVLPEGHELDGWTREDFMELNDHVRHMLHSRRSKFKRSMKGFGQYVSKPLGFLITLYATLITLFGLAWVLFLIGWINVGGSKQSQIINIIDNVLVALFAIMGDGLAPFRAVDTYHMIFIAHYTHLTWKIRNKRKLPDLKDKNDLPSQREKDIDVEFGATAQEDEHEYSVLDPRQQLRLMHHQNKFAKSHTFYKPHETFTHHAFPLRMLIAIVVILDCHSLLQMALGACTWSMEKPGQRPFALTTVILCCSICCNISGGVMIMIGDRMTRKKEIVERLFRQQLTEEAMKKMERRKVKEERKSLQISRPSASEGT